MSGSYLNKQVILKYIQQVACLWNVSPAIANLRAATLVISELWATIQSVCELWAVVNNQAVRRELYQSALYQVCVWNNA